MHLKEGKRVNFMSCVFSHNKQFSKNISPEHGGSVPASAGLKSSPGDFGEPSSFLNNGDHQDSSLLVHREGEGDHICICIFYPVAEWVAAVGKGDQS